MTCGCVLIVGLVLVFLARPGLPVPPTLCEKLSSCLSDVDDEREMCTHLSADDAIRFAMSEYLHVDCRLMHARQ